MRKLGFASLLLMAIISPALQGQSRESVLKAIQQTSKWSPADQPIQYDEKNIEAFAGKRASTLVHYGLTGITTQNWNGSEGNVHLTLFQMSDAIAPPAYASPAFFRVSVAEIASVASSSTIRSTT